MANPKKSSPQTRQPSLPATPASDAPKYTWEQLDAAFPAPTADERADHDVSPADAHQRAGAEIASQRILTDLQRWLGQLHDFAKRHPDPSAVVFGYDPALARVAAERARTLRRMLADTASGATTTALRRSAAQAIRENTVDVSRERYRAVLAALVGATLTDPARRAQVAGLSDRPGEDALPTALRTLSRLVADAAAPGSPVLRRCRARKLDARVAEELEGLASQIDRTRDALTGGTRRESIAQSAIDREDGALLELMEALMALFPAGKRGDVPALVPLATRRYFSGSGRRRAPSPDPVPTPTPGPA